MTRVCLIEDDAIMGEALVERLTLEGFEVDWQRTGRAGLAALRQTEAALAVIDVNLPDLSGIALFERLIASRIARPPTLFITGYGTIEDAVRLLKLGAADYVTNRRAMACSFSMRSATCRWPCNRACCGWCSRAN